MIYAPTNFDMPGAPDSMYILVSRQPRTANFTFQKLPDPCPPFGMNRSPPYHFIQRLRDFPPHLTDVLLLSSTASGEIGLFTRSNSSLSSTAAASGVYTTTAIANDSRRAQLPVTEEMTDTSPIGFVLDLSSKEPVKRPIPSEEIETTSTPLPALFALNNEGVLSAWWFIYNESVRQATVYPGLKACADSEGQAGRTSTFGHPAQGGPTFGTPSVSTGLQRPAPAFGTPSAPTFGLASLGVLTPIGATKLPWGTSTSPWNSNQGSSNGNSHSGNAAVTQTAGAVFGKSSFGAVTPMGGASFGAPSSLGAKTSAWGTPGAQSTSSNTSGDVRKSSIFGGNSSTASPFATLGGQAAPFSSFAGTAQHFETLGNHQNSSSSFGTATKTASSFGTSPSAAFGAPSLLGATKSPWATQAANSGMNSGSGRLWVTAASDNELEMKDGTSTEATPIEARKSANQTPSGFGLRGENFQLNSTLKPDATTSKDDAKPTGDDLFGSGFRTALSDTQKETVVEFKKEPDNSTHLADNNASGIPPQTTAADAGDTTQPVPNKEPLSSTISTQPVQASMQSPVSTNQHQPQKRTSTTTKPLETALPQVEPESAPFPPSPKLIKSEPVEEPAPLPPSPSLAPLPTENSKTTTPESAASTQPAEPVGPADLSPAGSLPVDLAGEEFESPASSAPPSSTKSVARLQREQVIPEEAPLPPDPTPRTIPAPAWSFPTLSGQDAKTPSLEVPLPAATDVSPSPEPLPLKPTFKSTLDVSATNPPFMFQRPGIGPQSPRSPSPVRALQNSLLSQRFLSPTKDRTSDISTFSTISGRPVGPPSRPTTISRPQLSVNDDDDDEDRKIQLELEEPIEPTRRLAPFLAHQDYVGRVVGEDIPSQAERLYRDINSMIDTLGLNARSLKSFIQGHSESFVDGGRERDHLEKEDEWCLIEIEDLAVIEKELGERVQAERLQDVIEKLEEIAIMHKDVVSLRTRAHSLQAIITSQNAQSPGSTRSTPLTADQNAVLVDLRNEFEQVQSLLASAEDAASFLAARMATLEAQANKGARAMPTVEAVLNTIAKMTRMAEQKSVDLDVIETQMRRLRFRSGASASAADLDAIMGTLKLGSSSCGGSPHATPIKKTNQQPRPPAPRGTYTFTYDSDSSEEENPGKTCNNGISDKQLDAYKSRVARRARVLALFKSKVEARGVKRTKA